MLVSINFLHHFSPQAVLWSGGRLTVYWYGCLLATAMLIAWLWLRYLARRLHWPSAWPTDIAWWSIVGGLIGARLYYVVLEWPYYAADWSAVWRIWEGGLAIHGAWLGGLIALLFWSRRQNLSLVLILAALAPGMALAQAIGRWGNYFNQELFGRPTDLPWGIPIEPLRRPVGWETAMYFHPTFLYESFLNFGLFVFLWLMMRRDAAWPQRPQSIVATYFLGYGLIRFLMEFWRIDAVPLLWGWRWPQLFSLLIVGLSAGWLIYRRLAKKV